MVSEPAGVRHVVAWLPPIRWATAGALWVAIALPPLVGVDTPLGAAWPVVLAAALCRTAVAVASDVGRHKGVYGVWLVCEVALLTGLLDITGGPYNPFVVMYVVQAWLAGATLSARWALFIGVLAASGFGWLAHDHLLHASADHHRLIDLPTHLFTMWIAAATTGELVGLYVARANAVLAQRQALVDEARDRAARSERLASLTTLAAGAAHELSTPLGTIAVAARELESALSRMDALADDARLIRQEVDRCQVILDGMSGRAGAGRAGAGRAGAGLPTDERLTVDQIAHLARARLSDSHRDRLRVEIASGVAVPSVAGAEAAQALTSLLKNAFDASRATEDVLLLVTQHGAMVRMEVHDSGTGMSDEVLRRAGEPFYTTKDPGRGLGLGLFLARTFAERAGGSLRLESGRGTTAILEIPCGVEATA